jgi:hypothetical protein
LKPENGLTSTELAYTVRSVFAPLPKLLIAVALAASIGLHWACLQVVAWTGMVISYSQDRPVSTAVSNTFDGQHPCKLCKQIAKGKHAEQKSEFQIESSKVKFACQPGIFVFSMPPFLWELPAPGELPELLSQPPPLPPPRPVPA